MNILKKSLFSFVVMVLYTNSIYATTSVVYNTGLNAEMGKVFLFLLSIALIVLVLFFTYKMDEIELISEESFKEDEVKIIKEKNNEEDITKLQFKNEIKEEVKKIDYEINEEISDEIEVSVEEDIATPKIENTNYENSKLNDMTMVFKTGLIRHSTDELEEDKDLLEIEKTIAKAKISKSKI